MILGIERHVAATCFRELDDAITEMQREAGDTRTFVLNAHAFQDEVPLGAVVYNLENVGTQVAASAFPDNAIVDFSAENIEAWKPRAVRHFPIGYRASFERFTRAAELDIDVVFSGCINDRRAAVLQALADRDLHVVAIPPGLYGAERDAVLARAKCAINMLWAPGRIFPALRVAHLISNRVPVISERCREGWSFVPTCEYEDLADAAERVVRDRVRAEDNAAFSYEKFKERPMVLP